MVVFTVHGAYYPTPEQALAAWQAGIGDLAAAQTAFTPVDDPALLADLLSAEEEGFLRPGGENADQLVEYYRGKRLAEAVISAVRLSRPPRRADFDAAATAQQFTAWLQAQRSDLEEVDLEELVTELADSWCVDGPAALYSTCSPHRIALTALHLRNYYQDDFATRLVALLPDWAGWLAERNGTSAELAERCRPYALGKTHADVGSDRSRPNYRARVLE
jgi:hypothetical protein